MKRRKSCQLRTGARTVRELWALSPQEPYVLRWGHLCHIPGATPVMPSEHVLPLCLLLICPTLEPFCFLYDLHFNKEKRKARREGVEKEESWEGQTVGTMEGPWGHFHVLWRSRMKWKPWRRAKCCFISPPSTTTSNSITAPRSKIKITFCGMKGWQWLWIQLRYHKLETTLAFEVC